MRVSKVFLLGGGSGLNGIPQAASNCRPVLFRKPRALLRVPGFEQRQRWRRRIEPRVEPTHRVAEKHLALRRVELFVRSLADVRRAHAEKQVLVRRADLVLRAVATASASDVAVHQGGPTETNVPFFVYLSN